MFKRPIDFLVALILLVFLVPILAATAIAVKLNSSGPAIHWSKRFGRDMSLFAMPKFRSMRTDTPQLPTHELTNGAQFLTGIGGFLRSSSLDELPQLWSVVKGDMSLVGPRPALFNQHDLMEMRRAAGIEALRPGITGWAQINGRDDLSLEGKVALEAEYCVRKNFLFDLQILFATLAKVFSRVGIRH